jgi:hypothetical protein
MCEICKNIITIFVSNFRYLDMKENIQLDQIKSSVLQALLVSKFIYN